MVVYQTDNEGNYVGETTADESPLENGVFLIPRGAVLQPPPAHDNNTHQAKWDGLSWRLEEYMPLVEPSLLPLPLPPPPPVPAKTDLIAEFNAKVDQLAALKAMIDNL